jgi:hypothetical protein
LHPKFKILEFLFFLIENLIKKHGIAYHVTQAFRGLH